MHEPMLAERGGEPFDSDGHYFEVKYDGVRCLAVIEDGRARLFGRSSAEYTAAFPEVAAALPGAVNARSALLDGELACVAADGTVEFQHIQRRVHRQKNVALAASRWPATFVAFDVLALNGQDLTAKGLGAGAWARKGLLEKLVDRTAHTIVAPHVEGAGIEFYEWCLGRGLEGVIAKRRDGLYRPGKRHADWLKFKGVLEDTFVVVGYTAGTGWREDLFGALVLAEQTPAGLRYAGSVGTGFDNATLLEVMETLRELPDSPCPFRTAPYEPKLKRWVAPRVIAEVKYHARTADGMLRFPVFMRLRPELVEGLRPDLIEGG